MPARAQRRVLTTGQYWQHYYRTHDEPSNELKEKVTPPERRQKSSRIVEAILRGLPGVRTARMPSRGCTKRSAIFD